MAMLAEPRRKQKIINLRAKNNAWSNDNTKFGQRMLEKMGWTSGKGLGANENGITEHVVARYKNDEKGLGFEDKNDQWTKHEDDFNSLLANLSNASDNTENLHSGISLEDKSKKSKARIHYHKFTRGKDISRYSEKDLANIFGKKSLKNTEEVHEPVKEDLKTTEQIFTEKGSMEDYFKNKLAQFKSKSKCKDPIENKNNEEYDEPSYGFCGFAQDTNETEICNGLGYNERNENSIEKPSIDDVVSESHTIQKKKKKSKKVDKIHMCENMNENISNTHYPEQIQQNIKCINKKNKKKDKSKVQQVSDVDEDDICRSVESTEEKIKKKKSKGKLRCEDNVNVEQSLIYSSSYEIPVQSKKKSKKDSDSTLNTEVENISCDLDQEQLSQQKKKKSKTKNKSIVEEIIHDNTNIDYLPKKKKKKKCKE